MGRSANPENIARLLNTAFTDIELRCLCYDNRIFIPVYNQLSQGMIKSDLMKLLLEHTIRNNQVDSLLNIAKRNRPDAFENCKLYYLEDHRINEKSIETPRNNHQDSSKQVAPMPSRASKSYNFRNINALLTEGFTIDELRSFCFVEPDFYPIFEKVNNSSDKSKVILLVLDYARKRLLVDVLLAWVEQEIPARYQAGRPYFVEK